MIQHKLAFYKNYKSSWHLTITIYVHLLLYI
nr:MAG TPA: hypothetical protein [Caudoviricetes sp.]